MPPALRAATLLLGLASFLARGEDALSSSSPSDSLLLEANQALSAKDLTTAETKLNEAEKIDPKNKVLFTLRARVAMERQDWVKAQAALDQALQIDPKFFSALFNAAEIFYLQKRYPEARAKFEGMLPDTTAKSIEQDLIRYKIFLCCLLDGKTDEAQRQFDSFDIDGITPIYYFAKAALAFTRSNRNEAILALSAAEKVYDPQLILLFAEPVWEAGWLPRPTPAPKN